MGLTPGQLTLAVRLALENSDAIKSLEGFASKMTKEVNAVDKAFGMLGKNSGKGMATALKQMVDGIKSISTSLSNIDKGNVFGKLSTSMDHFSSSIKDVVGDIKVLTEQMQRLSNMKVSPKVESGKSSTKSSSGSSYEKSWEKNIREKETNPKLTKSSQAKFDNDFEYQKQAYKQREDLEKRMLSKNAGEVARAKEQARLHQDILSQDNAKSKENYGIKKAIADAQFKDREKERRENLRYQGEAWAAMDKENIAVQKSIERSQKKEQRDLAREYRIGDQHDIYKENKRVSKEKQDKKQYEKDFAKLAKNEYEIKKQENDDIKWQAKEKKRIHQETMQRSAAAYKEIDRINADKDRADWEKENSQHKQYLEYTRSQPYKDSKFLKRGQSGQINTTKEMNAFVKKFGTGMDTKEFDTLIRSQALFQNNANNVENLAKHYHNLRAAEMGAKVQVDQFGQSMSVMDRIMSKQGEAIGRLARYYVSFLTLSQVPNMFNKIAEDVMALTDGMKDLEKYLPKGSQTGDLLGGAYGIANKYGVSVKDVVGAYSEFAQQGLQANQILSATETAFLGANVAAMGFADVVKYLVTATQNWNISMANSSILIDKIALLQARSAVTAERLVQIVQRSASMAEQVGLSPDKLMAFGTAIGEKTQLSGEVIGTSIRTILERSQRSKTLSELKNIQAFQNTDFVNAQTGELMKADKILETVASKWQTLTDVERKAVGELIAGGRQINSFVALMNNFDRALQLNEMSLNSLGFAQEANMTEMQKLSKTWTQFTNILSGSMSGAVIPLAAAFNYLLKGINEFGLATSGVMNFINALALNLGIAVAGVYGLTKALAGLKDAWLFLQGIEVLAGLGGWATLAVAAMATIGGYLYNNSRLSQDITKEQQSYNDELSNTIKKLEQISNIQDFELQKKRVNETIQAMDPKQREAFFNNLQAVAPSMVGVQGSQQVVIIKNEGSLQYLLKYMKASTLETAGLGPSQSQSAIELLKFIREKTSRNQITTTKDLQELLSFAKPANDMSFWDEKLKNAEDQGAIEYYSAKREEAKRQYSEMLSKSPIAVQGAENLSYFGLDAEKQAPITKLLEGKSMADVLNLLDTVLGKQEDIKSVSEKRVSKEAEYLSLLRQEVDLSVKMKESREKSGKLGDSTEYNRILETLLLIDQVSAKINQLRQEENTLLQSKNTENSVQVADQLSKVTEEISKQEGRLIGLQKVLIQYHQEFTNYANGLTTAFSGAVIATNGLINVVQNLATALNNLPRNINIGIGIGIAAGNVGGQPAIDLQKRWDDLQKTRTEDVIAGQKLSSQKGKRTFSTKETQQILKAEDYEKSLSDFETEARKATSDAVRAQMVNKAENEKFNIENARALDRSGAASAKRMGETKAHLEAMRQIHALESDISAQKKIQSMYSGLLEDSTMMRYDRDIADLEAKKSQYLQMAQVKGLKPEEAEKYKSQAQEMDAAIASAQKYRGEVEKIDAVEKRVKDNKFLMDRAKDMFSFQQEWGNLQFQKIYEPTYGEKEDFAVAQQMQKIEFERAMLEKIRTTELDKKTTALTVQNNLAEEGLKKSQEQLQVEIDKQMASNEAIKNQERAVENAERELYLVRERMAVERRKEAMAATKEIQSMFANTLAEAFDFGKRKKELEPLLKDMAKLTQQQNMEAMSVAGAEISGSVDQINSAREKWFQTNQQIGEVRDKMNDVNNKTKIWKDLLSNIGSSIMKKIADVFSEILFKKTGLAEDLTGMFGGLFGMREQGRSTTSSALQGIAVGIAPGVGGGWQGLLGGGTGVGGGANVLMSKAASLMGGSYAGGGNVTQNITVAGGGSAGGGLGSLLGGGGTKDPLLSGKAMSYLGYAATGYALGGLSSNKGTSALLGAAGGFLMGGGAVGAIIGGIAGLFGNKKKSEEQAPTPPREFYPLVKNSESLDRNTAALMKLSEGMFNAPAEFQMNKMQLEKNSSGQPTFNIVVKVDSKSSVGKIESIERSYAASRNNISTVTSAQWG